MKNDFKYNDCSLCGRLLTAMPVVNTIKADPSLRHWPLVGAADPSGSRTDAAGRRVPIPW